MQGHQVAVSGDPPERHVVLRGATKNIRVRLWSVALVGSLSSNIARYLFRCKLFIAPVADDNICHFLPEARDDPLEATFFTCGQKTTPSLVETSNRDELSVPVTNAFFFWAVQSSTMRPVYGCTYFCGAVDILDREDVSQAVEQHLSQRWHQLSGCDQDIDTLPPVGGTNFQQLRYRGEIAADC